jgi:hypothetical protein
MVPKYELNRSSSSKELKTNSAIELRIVADSIGTWACWKNEKCLAETLKLTVLAWTRRRDIATKQSVDFRPCLDLSKQLTI